MAREVDRSMKDMEERMYKVLNEKLDQNNRRFSDNFYK